MGIRLLSIEAEVKVNIKVELSFNKLPHKWLLLKKKKLN